MDTVNHRKYDGCKWGITTPATLSAPASGYRTCRYLSTHNRYAGNKEKTEKFYFVSGINCDADKAYEQMVHVKKRFGKMHGNVAYHGYQSFHPGEVTPQQCHEIGLKLARQLWGECYQVLVATHIDKDHIHNHLLINSVSFVDGKKFNDNKKA